MKVLAVTFLACVLAVHAAPYGGIVDPGFSGVNPMMTGMGMLPSSSQQFNSVGGGQQHGLGSSGFGQQGHQQGGGSTGHNTGHHSKNFSSVTQGSESDSHDVGGASGFGSTGNSGGAFNNFNHGQSGYGQQGANSFLQG